MTILKKLALGLAVALVLGVVAVAVVYQVTGPEGPPAGSASALALAERPYAVGQRDLTFVDDDRPTAVNGDYEGAPNRTLVTSLWYPQAEVPGGSPLVIYSHGFMSNRDGGSYLAEALAARGYVVASADFPLSNGQAPGGPNPADVVNQPGDVSFLIDSVLALTGDDKPFPGTVDSARIGVAGLSLGGLTSTLAGYHPRWHDERIRAVVSIAGPAAMFTRRFFTTSAAPFLMIGGTEDAIVDFDTHAAIIPDRAPQGTLLAIRNGSHVAFAGPAEPAMRFMAHPDNLGCRALTADDAAESGVDGEAEAAAPENPFSGLGGIADGINPDATMLEICTKPLGEALHPGRQQLITTVAVLSFFDSQFALEPDERRTARERLQVEMANDFPEVSVHL